MIEIRKAEAEDREAVARLIEQLEEAPMDRKFLTVFIWKI